MRDSNELGLLHDFVNAYKDGPSCILCYVDGSKTPTVCASNETFGKPEEVDLFKYLALSSRASRRESRASNWSITSLQGGYLVCLGRAEASNGAALILEEDRSSGSQARQRTVSSKLQSQEVSHSGPQTRSTSKRVRSDSLSNGQVPESISKRIKATSGSSSSAAWFNLWENLEVPGLTRQQMRDHVELIRNIDWSATELGSIDTWDTLLVAAVTQILAAPYPILLIWGKDMTCIYNHFYVDNVRKKHPSLLGQKYYIGFAERKLASLVRATNGH